MRHCFAVNFNTNINKVEGFFSGNRRLTVAKTHTHTWGISL